MAVRIRDVWATFRSHTNTDGRNNLDHAILAGYWLLKAQQHGGGGGYSHSYHLVRGWAKPYPETTGYIIPTLLALAEAAENPRFKLSAQNAGRWLLTIQNTDGSFADLDGQTQVFDTAQVLRGLLALASGPEGENYRLAALRAGRWLVSAQEEDGSWSRHGYKRRPHSYYAFASSALALAGTTLREASFVEAARKNIHWVLAQQQPNGFFNRMDFDGEAPYLHTIAYTLQGLLESFQQFNEKKIPESIRRSIDSLLSIEKRDGILRSQYNPDWTPANRERCTTGLAQWADLLLSLPGGEDRHRLSAQKTLDYLKTRQIIDGGDGVQGGLPSSVPAWGRYGRLSFSNWNLKFLIDALLENRDTKTRGMP